LALGAVWTTAQFDRLHPSCGSHARREVGARQIQPEAEEDAGRRPNCTLQACHRNPNVGLVRHALILAEGPATETFVDNVDRLSCDNWAEHETIYPHGKPLEEMDFPRAKSRRQVTLRMRAALDARTERLDCAVARVA
jgi:hypothetical protein